MNGLSLNIAANRRTRNYSASERVRQVLWAAGQVLFRLSPRPCFGFRSQILRLFGADVGQEVHIYSSATIYFPWNLRIGDWSSVGEGAMIYNLGQVTIGQSVTISQRAHLCAGTHDYTKPDMPLLKPPIRIENLAWIL